MDKIVICENCKNFHYKGVKKCECGSTSFAPTSDYNEKFINPFPNGFENWQETHFEVVNFITTKTIGTQDNILTKLQSEEGCTSLYDVAKEWTNEFEKLNTGREWDGEFFEEIESFCQNKLKI